MGAPHAGTASTTVRRRGTVLEHGVPPTYEIVEIPYDKAASEAGPAADLGARVGRAHKAHGQPTAGKPPLFLQKPVHQPGPGGL